MLLWPVDFVAGDLHEGFFLSRKIRRVSLYISAAVN